MEKENMPVIDFSDYPAPDTEEFIWMPEDEFDEYETYCEYIQLGTSVPPRTNIESGFYCQQEMEDGELCDGTIEVKQIDVPRQIRWSCRKCGDKGAIVNFEDTPWDNSHLPEHEKEMFLEHFFSDIMDEDFFEDEFYDLDQDEVAGPFDDFEYYLNPYDPDGEQTGVPSSDIIEELLTCDWMNPESPVYLNDNIPLKELENSFFFYNARRFLLTLKEDETFPLTRLNYLKRKVVRKLMEQTRWPKNYIEDIRKYKQNPDETDVWLLHGIRILLDLAKMIKQEENQYRLNTGMLHYLDNENAGQLYRLLFSTYFKEMNIGYLGSTFEFAHLQYSVPFVLYKLQKLAKDWTSIEELLPDILLFSVHLELQFEGLDETGTAHDFLYEDLFSALERFALVKTRRAAGTVDPESFNASYPDQIRITPLFEKFIEFKV